MLGRSIGLSDDKLAHLGDDPLPQGVYNDDEAGIIRYAQKATRMEPIDDSTYSALEEQFSTEQIIEICMVVGLAQLSNRFNLTFLTEVDDYILEANARADDEPGALQMAYPPMPTAGPRQKQTRSGR
jgi:hypothetical protein